MTRTCDHLVLGAGLRGLGAALALPAAGRLVVDAQPAPGGSTRTQRSNGFACELGRFAFAPDEIAPLLDRLSAPPAPVTAATAIGHMFDGERLVEVAVDPLPVSFRSGAESLVQACRRELGADLLLGRAAEAVRPCDGGFEVVLAGEAPTTLRTARLMVCVPEDRAAMLFGALDPHLAEVAGLLTHEVHAFVFLGGLAHDCAGLRGYGVVPAPGVAAQVAETIYCSNVFPGCCAADRCLLRSELTGAAAVDDDATLVATATRELARWTGHTAPFGFTKVHRFTRLARDGAFAECRARLRGMSTKAPNLCFA